MVFAPQSGNPFPFHHLPLISGPFMMVAFPILFSV